MIESVPPSATMWADFEWSRLRKDMVNFTLFALVSPILNHVFLARRGPECFDIGAVEFTAARDIRREADGVDDDDH